MHYQLYPTESIVLRIDEPQAISTISRTSVGPRAGTASPTPSQVTKPASP